MIREHFQKARSAKQWMAAANLLTFSPAEIDDLLSIQYGDKRLFALLSLLFTFVDLRNQFHIDHVFPISRFTSARLKRAGIHEAEIEGLSQAANELS